IRKFHAVCLSCGAGWMVAVVFVDPNIKQHKRKDCSKDLERNPSHHFGSWRSVLWSDVVGNLSTIPKKLRNVKSVVQGKCSLACVLIQSAPAVLLSDTVDNSLSPS